MIENIKQGTDLAERRQISRRFALIEQSEVVLGEPSDAFPNGVVLTEGEGIDIQTSVGKITISVDGGEIYVNGVSLSETVETVGKILIWLVDQVGLTLSPTLVKAYQRAHQ